MNEDANCVFTKNISMIHRHQQILINNYLNPYNIGSGQYIFLVKIYENPDISQKDLTALVKIDKATTAKALKKLEAEGYIYRCQNEDDMRYNNLNLTKKGNNFIPELFKILKNITDIITFGLGNDECESMLKSFNIILKNIHKYTKNASI